MALAGKFGDQSDIGQLAFARGAEIEFEHPDLDPRAVDHGPDADGIVMDDRRQPVIGHHQSREP